MHRFICESGLVRGKQPVLTDIEQVLQALMYDARIEQPANARASVLDAEPMYKLTPPLASIDGLALAFTSVPPIDECECAHCLEGLTEQPCAMMTAWLELTHPCRQD